MKKLFKSALAISALFMVAACDKNSESSKTDPSSSTGGVEESQDETTSKPTPQPESWDYEVSLPSTELLEEAKTPRIVEGAPDLMIIGAVLDTYYYYHFETMSGYEYIKVYNNTNTDYNLKNHRIVLGNPIQGQNYENEAARVGNEVLSTGLLFMGLVDEDYIIPSKSIGLIWLHPYYWTAGSGTSGYTKEFSSAIMHSDGFDQKGAMSQTLSDFRSFWDMEESSVPVYKLTNMAIAGKMSVAGQETSPMYPIYSPGAGSGFTHLNSTLLRSIEIQKFNDQNGAASIELLNKYDELPADKQKKPDPVYGKEAFNVMEIKENSEAVDGYYYENCWKYFDPISRINFLGRVNTATMTPGQESVDFSVTSGPGISGIENTVELQFRVPLTGERIMQWQLPLRERAKYDKYLTGPQKEVMRFSMEDVTTLKYINKTIKLLVNPADGIDKINWRTDELKNEGRTSCAAPTKIHLINVTAPSAN